MTVRIFDRMEECTDEAVQAMIPLVSAQRREQALRYKHTLGRFCCLKSWLMLQEEMKSFHFPLPTFNYEKYGKPYLENGPFFSISHCKEGIAVAIDDKPVGIDIEGIRHANDDLIERTMNETERVGMDDRKFTRLWTQKEAVVKCIGTGIESFEQLQHILSDARDIGISTVEKEKYIYSIAYGKLRSFGA